MIESLEDLHFVNEWAQERDAIERGLTVARDEDGVLHVWDEEERREALAERDLDRAHAAAEDAAERHLARI